MTIIVTSHERRDVSRHGWFNCLFNGSLKLITKEILKLRIIGPVWWESIGEFHQSHDAVVKSINIQESNKLSLLNVKCVVIFEAIELLVIMNRIWSMYLIVLGICQQYGFNRDVSRDQGTKIQHFNLSIFSMKWYQALLYQSILHLLSVHM